MGIISMTLQNVRSLRQPKFKMNGTKLLSGLCTLWLTACTLAPKYQVPFMPISPHYKEGGPWILVKSPHLLNEKNRDWWELFQDRTLDQLEQQVTCGNQNLKVALARYQEALADAQAARSALYPTITGLGNAVRQKNSTTVANIAAQPQSTYNNYLLGGSLTYIIDAWGRVRNTVIASQDNARASGFDLAAIELSLHSELAQDYFSLRGYESTQRILDATVIAYEKAFYLTHQRHKEGLAAEGDEDQAKTQLEMAKTLAIDTRLKRAQLEHAIAVLTGQIPANFSLKTSKIPLKLVTVVPEVPATLLLKRPDIAAAEQRVEAANASIGVARAAFFPDFNFTTVGGVQSNAFVSLFSAPSLFWSLGPVAGLALAQPLMTQVIFDGFLIQALLKKAKASYFEAVSAYRQTVLTAFQQVEDGLVAIRRLDQEIKTQKASVVAAKRALYQSNQRYKGGIATYLDVIITENEALQAQLALVNIQTRRQIASVDLIEALGGGWVVPCCRTQ